MKHAIPTKVSQPLFSLEEIRLLKGRPTSYQPEFKEQVIDVMARGYSLGALAGTVGVSRVTINNWIDRYPDFFEACARAKAISQLHWETRFIDAIDRQLPTCQAIIFALCNVGREDWKNRQEIEHTGEIKLSAIIESAMQRIAAARTIEGTIASPDPDTCF